jgi:hypothetical protein
MTPSESKPRDGQDHVGLKRVQRGARSGIAGAAMLVLAACVPVPASVDLVVGNESGAPALIRIATEDQATEAWVRLPDGARTTVRAWPAGGLHAVAMVVGDGCEVLSPDPWGVIPTSNGDPATAMAVSTTLQVYSTGVEDVADLVEIDDAMIPTPCPGFVLSENP